MLKLQSGGDGTPIAYRCSGAGPPLLLVHGTTADHTRWPSVLPEFEKYFTVYVIDRRGRGESGDSDTYSIKLESEDIATVINSIDEPVNILGHSYGALCCLESALLTKNIAKLILYEPYFTTGDDVYPPGIADRIQELVDVGDRDGAVSMMFREIADMPEAELEMLRSLPSWKKRVAMAHTIARETRAEEMYTFNPIRFGGLNVQTLLLLGADSPAAIKRATESVHDAIPDSRIVEMPGQQHIAMNTAPDLFTYEVIQFLLS